MTQEGKRKRRFVRPMKARGWRSLRELYMPGNNDALFANNMEAIAAVNNHDAGSNQAMEAAYSRVPKRKSSALASEYQAELQPAKRRRTAHLDASFPSAAPFGNFPHPATITWDNAFPIDQLQADIPTKRPGSDDYLGPCYPRTPSPSTPARQSNPDSFFHTPIPSMTANLQKDAELAQELNDADMAEALLDAIECRARAMAGTGQQMLIFGDNRQPSPPASPFIGSRASMTYPVPVILPVYSGSVACSGSLDSASSSPLHPVRTMDYFSLSANTSRTVWPARRPQAAY